MDDIDIDEDKKIEVVSGDGTSLNLSPVYEHLKALKPTPKKENKKEIIIPTATVIKEKADKKQIEDDIDSLLTEDDPEGNKVTMIMDADDEDEQDEMDAILEVDEDTEELVDDSTELVEEDVLDEPDTEYDEDNVDDASSDALLSDIFDFDEIESEEIIEEVVEEIRNDNKVTLIMDGDDDDDNQDDVVENDMNSEELDDDSNDDEDDDDSDPWMDLLEQVETNNNE